LNSRAGVEPDRESNPSLWFLHHALCYQHCLTKKNSLPSIDDIRGSSLPAQDADIVLMVGAGNNNNVIVEIQKNRNKGFDPENAVTYLNKIPDGIRIM